MYKITKNYIGGTNNNILCRDSLITSSTKKCLQYVIQNNYYDEYDLNSDSIITSNDIIYYMNNILCEHENDRKIYLSNLISEYKDLYIKYLTAKRANLEERKQNAKTKIYEWLGTVSTTSNYISKLILEQINLKNGNVEARFNFKKGEKI